MPRKEYSAIPMPRARNIGNDASQTSSSSSSTSFTGVLSKDIVFTADMSAIDESHRTATRERRQRKKTGRHEKATQSYLADKQDYIKFAALDGSSGEVYMRGVKVPSDKQKWGYPYVTVDRVLYYCHHILKSGFQKRKGGKRGKRVIYAPENSTWFVDFLAICPDTMDDRENVNWDKPLTWKGSADGILKACADLKKEQMATDQGKAIYTSAADLEPLRGPTSTHGRFKAIQQEMEMKMNVSRRK